MPCNYECLGRHFNKKHLGVVLGTLNRSGTLYTRRGGCQKVFVGFLENKSIANHSRSCSSTLSMLIPNPGPDVPAAVVAGAQAPLALPASDVAETLAM
jgi:hypothetical protein